VKAYTSGKPAHRRRTRDVEEFSRSSELNAMRCAKCLEPSLRRGTAVDRRTVPAATHVWPRDRPGCCRGVRTWRACGAAQLFPADVGGALEKCRSRAARGARRFTCARSPYGQKSRVALVLSRRRRLVRSWRSGSKGIGTTLLECSVRRNRRDRHAPNVDRSVLAPVSGSDAEPDAEGVNVNAPWFASQCDAGCH